MDVIKTFQKKTLEGLLRIFGIQQNTGNIVRLVTGSVRMSYFDNPQCTHCGYNFDSYQEYCDAQIEFGDDDGTTLLECPSCGEQFRVNTEDVEGLIE